MAAAADPMLFGIALGTLVAYLLLGGVRREGAALPVCPVLCGPYRDPSYTYACMGCGGMTARPPPKVTATGLAQNLGQLEAVNRDLQSKYWANLKLLGQPCNFYAPRPGLLRARRGALRAGGIIVSIAELC